MYYKRLFSIYKLYENRNEQKQQKTKKKINLLFIEKRQKKENQFILHSIKSRRTILSQFINTVHYLSVYRMEF